MAACWVGVEAEAEDAVQTVSSHARYRSLFHVTGLRTMEGEMRRLPCNFVAVDLCRVEIDRG